MLVMSSILLHRRRVAGMILITAVLVVIAFQFAVSLGGFRHETVPEFGNSQDFTNGRTPTPVDSIEECLDDDACLGRLASKISRVWTKHSWEAWCAAQPPPQQQDNKEQEQPVQGLVLIKVPKSASSTMAGVVLRIQHRHNCTVHWKHQLAREKAWSSDNDSLRVAPIRNPTSRALSSVFFHHVSFHGRHQPSDSFVIQHLNETAHNFILDYLTNNQPISSDHSSATLQLVESVRQVVNFYHFLFVVDRLDESLVVWSLLTGLPWTDLITMSSKRSGSWYLSGPRCVALARPVVSNGIQAFLTSREWKRNHAGDRLLYSVTSHSLDRTIDDLGRDLFTQELLRFQQLRREMEEACHNETYFPCTSNGIPQLEHSRKNCYERDFGCGYPCMDRFVQNNLQQ
jgi:hypothetical protein